ncbi:MAG: 2-keto-4-pentenoate hydratase [Sphingopyxis sp.]
MLGKAAIADNAAQNGGSVPNGARRVDDAPNGAHGVDDAAVRAVASAFVAARRSATIIADYPGIPPQDLATAYAMQDCGIILDQRPVGGWKVGRIQPPLDATLGYTRLAGPIFAPTIITAHAGTCAMMPVFGGGFAAVEAELMLHVAHAPATDPAQMDDDAILALMDDVRVGVEMASSPFPGINANGPLVTISDFGNNYGLLIGPTLPDWRTRNLAALDAMVAIDGAQVGANNMLALPGGPLESARFLLANLCARGLLGGDGAFAPFWISAGAITGVHEIAPGSRARATFDGQLHVDCMAVAVERNSTESGGA